MEGFRYKDVIRSRPLWLAFTILTAISIYLTINVRTLNETNPILSRRNIETPNFQRLTQELGVGRITYNEYLQKQSEVDELYNVSFTTEGGDVIIIPKGTKGKIFPGGANFIGNFLASIDEGRTWTLYIYDTDPDTARSVETVEQACGPWTKFPRKIIN